MNKLFLLSGAAFGFLAVISRSLSSHAIRSALETRGKLENFNLASDYLLFHGLALLVVSALGRQMPQAGYGYAGALFILGSFLFQGSVFFKSFYAMGALGMLTPLGGLLLMLGWIALFVAALRS